MMIKICCCYAPEDAELHLELKQAVGITEGSKQFVSWYDGEIHPGTESMREVETHVTTADLILLLVSPALLDAAHPSGLLQVAASGQRMGAAQVIPILLRPVKWQESWLTELPVLPRDGQPVAQAHHRSVVFSGIANRIRTVISDLIAQKAERPWTWMGPEYVCPFDGSNGNVSMLITKQGEYVFECRACGGLRLWSGGPGRQASP